MAIDLVELRTVQLPLVSPFRTSFGVETVREALLVRLRAGDVEGWGECVAMAHPRYSSEFVASARLVLRDHLAPIALQLGELQAARLEQQLDPIRGHPMAKAALLLAVLDAELRLAGRPLHAELGGTRDRVPAGVSIGIQSSVGALLDVVGSSLEQGYRRIKLKIEPGWDVEPVRAVRERFDDIVLQVDANAAYSLGDARLLAALDPFDLLLIEQPLQEDDLRAHAALARQLRTPICLDESITSARAAADAIALGACAIVNIKPGRVGGYHEARRVHDVCVANGVPVWCGGMLETGIGRAANAALASLPGFTLPGDLSASDRYFATDITEPFVLEDGCLIVPDGPGLGVTVDMDAVEKATVHVESVCL
jgi:O-succinylbenzoate synthase